MELRTRHWRRGRLGSAWALGERMTQCGRTTDEEVDGQDMENSIWRQHSAVFVAVFGARGVSDLYSTEEFSKFE